MKKEGRYDKIHGIRMSDEQYKKLSSLCKILNLTWYELIDFILKRLDAIVTQNQELPKEIVAQFKKPTVEDVIAYCTERGKGVDGTKFWNFYESKGWKVGKEKMKDWRASVHTWERSITKRKIIKL